MSRLRVHELFDQQHLDECRKKAGLPPDAPLPDVVIALVDKGEYQLAAELLFGIPYELASQLMTTASHNLYLALGEGKHPEFIKEIARIHHWDNQGNLECFTVQVFLHERFLIPKDKASPELREFLESYLAEECEHHLPAPIV